MPNKLTTITMQNISIEFPGVKALSNVDFSIQSGRIEALIGANGAGKSTLMKVLSGAYSHYTGTISIDGQEVHIRTPRDAKSLGIETVYQEVDTALIPYLTVAENIMLDHTVNNMKFKSFINWQKMHREAARLLSQLNVHIDTQAITSSLSLAQKQMVLIARAISREVSFLILDEPTAPLSHTETEELFRVVNTLARNNGVGIIFISHRLPEIFEICEDITIMKDGQIVRKSKIAEITIPEVVESMLGRKMEENYPPRLNQPGEILFEVRNLTDKSGLVKNISLSVRAGEIVGIAGLVGAGKTELCKTIFGAMPIESGEILLRGKPLKIKSPSQAVAQRVALVPEERRKEGVLVEEPVYSNLTIANMKLFTGLLSLIKSKKEHQKARQIIQEIGVKTPSENQRVAFLSGGNQQKVAVGKWLIADADVYIFDEPTKGVDVGAKRDIFELISQLAQRGKAILYATCELAEILGITDKTYVMYDGQFSMELITPRTDEKEILYYSAGGK